MCGRFTLRTNPEVWAHYFFSASWDAQFPGWQPRFNIAPTQLIAAVRSGPEPGELRGATLRWGLIPAWAKDPKIGSQMINARSETVAEKPAFRAAFRRQRCVIPADGFFEWRTDGRQKRPFYITRPDRSPFLFAGLWERWQGPAAVIESATILTMPANEFLSDLHDRMPVVLDPAAAQLWLTMPADSPHWKEQLTKLFQPVSNDFWERFEVAPAVNTAKAQGPQLIQPLIPPATLF